MENEIQNNYINKRFFIIFSLVIFTFTFFSDFEFVKSLRPQCLVFTSDMVIRKDHLEERSVKPSLLHQFRNTQEKQLTNEEYEGQIKPILIEKIKYFSGYWYSNDKTDNLFINSSNFTSLGNEGRLEIAFYIYDTNVTFISILMRDGEYNDNIIKIQLTAIANFRLDEEGLVVLTLNNVKGATRKYHFFNEIRDDELTQRLNQKLNKLIFMTTFLRTSYRNILMVKKGELTSSDNDFKIVFGFLDPPLNVTFNTLIFIKFY